MELASKSNIKTDAKYWYKAAKTSHFPENGGAAVLIESKQIAVFNFTSKGEWYATQNLCPHRFEMVLSRGLIGDAAGEPKVVCPLHKNSFSLETGMCLSGAPYKIEVYAVKIEDGYVYIGASEPFL